MTATPSTKRTRSGSETRRTHRRVNLRVTEQDYQALSLKAEAAGVSIPGYLRACALDAPQVKARRRALPEKTLLTRLFGQTRKAGGNLAQLLRAVHFGEPWLAEELRDAIAEMNRAGDAIREALGYR